MSKIGIIGSGFAGLSAASLLAKQGEDVSVFEKNSALGGRARQIKEGGYTFDMGPSWYWMPDVFENYFNQFGHTTSDFYELKKLDPNFKIIFGKDDFWDIPSDWEALLDLFENTEKGAASKLKKFMSEAKYKYEKSMSDLIYKPGHSLLEFMDLSLVPDVFKLQLFSSFKKHVQGYFKDPRLVSLMEFPVLFLGAMPKDTPALYSMMNYSGLVQGTYYPMGGFGKIIDAFVKIAKENGVSFYSNANVERINVTNKRVNSITASSNDFQLDKLIAASDYHHTESKLLEEQYRNYSEKYWDKKTFAPSCLIFYIGVNTKVPALDHHNLFFDADYNAHAEEIYSTKQWPKDPLFYVCKPSETDASVAPQGHENMFLLMPIPPGIKDSEEQRQKYYELMIQRIEKFSKTEIKSKIDFKKSFCINDFVSEYNSYKGNAYGLANTLDQTAFLKPKLRNKKVENLFYTGQLTVPGPGVPPALISGQIVASEILKY